MQNQDHDFARLGSLVAHLRSALHVPNQLAIQAASAWDEWSRGMSGMYEKRDMPNVQGREEPTPARNVKTLQLISYAVYGAPEGYYAKTDFACLNRNGITHNASTHRN